MTGELNPLQSWLLGHIDTPTLLDRIAEMGESGIDVLRQYGRAQVDAGYAADLLEEAHRAAGVDEQAYAFYEALIDPHDRAELDAQEAEGQPVDAAREQRRRELAELRPALGLEPPAAETDHEAERG